MDYEVISNNPSPSISDLNKKAIQKLYQLIDALDSKSEPDLVRACIESLAKFNSSLKGSSILPQEETEAERRERENADVIQEALRG